ncbi:MAG: GNAT family N-acetyltransferase [Bacteroidota bacterium]|jgi:GNAT superfamily N-acetyltransferase|nr:GNAT family N-acetyltransferase [Terrimonas sp.]
MSNHHTSYVVQTASLADIELIRELCMQVWPQTYSSILTEEQLAYMLEWMYSPASLAQQMKEGATFLLLYQEQTPIGYASYQSLQASHFKLHKLYVLPHVQGKGAGRIFLTDLLQRIKELGAHTLELQVNRYNKAVGFYQQMGFTIRETADIEIGNGFYMNDYIMQIAL